VNVAFSVITVFINIKCHIAIHSSIMGNKWGGTS